MRAWWRELRAELAYLIGVTWLSARMVRLPRASAGEAGGAGGAAAARRRQQAVVKRPLAPVTWRGPQGG